MNALGVVMKGENRWALDGLQKAMQHLAKAEPEQASAFGQRLTEGVAAGSEKANAVVRFGRWLRDGGIDVLFDSPGGKRFLFAASGLKAGSPAMDKAIGRFMDNLPKASGARVGKASAEIPFAASELQPQPQQ